MEMRLVLAVTGASGVELAIKLLKELNKRDVSVDVVVSDSALTVCKHELGMECQEFLDTLKESASAVYRENELWAPMASGTYEHGGMVVLPCSMKTLAMIAHGYDSNLIGRAASVCLKEGRALLLCIRETPLRRSHIMNMLLAKEDGATILPLMMSFYGKNKESEDKYEFMVSNIIGKITSFFGIEYDAKWRWCSDGANEER